MLTKNDWFNTSLRDRILDKKARFNTIISPYKFYALDFDAAADYTAQEIYKTYPNLYVALSGGLDSEFVLRCFTRNNIPVKPIIVLCGNSEESVYAFKACNDLDITPIVLEISEQELVEFFKTNIFEKFAGTGYNSTHNLIAAKYVSEIPNAYIVSGNHFLSDGHNAISDQEYFFAYEWDFYTDYFLEPCININFYIYTLELVYAAAPRINTTWIDYKHKIFNLAFREKLRYNYSKDTQHKLNILVRQLNSLQKNIGETWSKEQFFSYFDKHNLSLGA